MLFRSALACRIQRDRVLARPLAQQEKTVQEGRPVLCQWARGASIPPLGPGFEQSCQEVGLGVTHALQLLALPPTLYRLWPGHAHHERSLHHQVQD